MSLVESSSLFATNVTGKSIMNDDDLLSSILGMWTIQVLSVFAVTFSSFIKWKYILAAVGFQSSLTKSGSKNALPNTTSDYLIF